MDDHLQLVEDCEARESKLTDWERGFIDSVGRVLRNGGRLTDKQAETLNTIWDKVT